MADPTPTTSSSIDPAIEKKARCAGLVEQLLEAGACSVALFDTCWGSVYRNSGHATVLTLLIQAEGRATVVERLLKAGADINHQATRKPRASLVAAPAWATHMTPIYAASFRGVAPVVELLINAGADVNLTATGHAALHVASQWGHASVVELLIKAGAHVNPATAAGHTALHVASQMGHGSVVELLIKAGAHVNQATASGYAALHAASKSGHEQVALLLLAAGAQVGPSTNPQLAKSVAQAHEWERAMQRRRISELEAQVANFQHAIPHLIAGAANGLSSRKRKQ
jgi:hypothetical protein